MLFILCSQPRFSQLNNGCKAKKILRIGQLHLLFLLLSLLLRWGASWFSAIHYDNIYPINKALLFSKKD
ncbi:MAG: hypothetical protein R2795_26640 [Saprospiraceae bacterium]